jgi:photosystem II stability/assembly factor-like uncharacterized protein
LHTADAGQNWAASPANGKERPSVAAFGAGAYWVGSEYGGLWRAANETSTFQPVVAPVGTFRAIHFSGRLGFAVGDGGTIIRTSDGGTSWTLASTAPADLRSVAIDPTGKSVVAAGKSGLLWRSLDSGLTWSQAQVATSVQLNGAAFRQDTSEGWVVGDNGTIFYTPDGAQTWRSMDSPSSANLTAIEGL